MKPQTLLLLLAGLGLSACGGVTDFFSSKSVTFDGVDFRGRAEVADKSDRRHFIASAGPAARSAAGVREAVRYQGVRYCIHNFGISDIAWEIAPEAEVLPMEGDRVVLKGRCLT